MIIFVSVQMTLLKPSADIVKCCFAQTYMCIYKQYLRVEKNKTKNTDTTMIFP